MRGTLITYKMDPNSVLLNKVTGVHTAQMEEVGKIKIIRFVAKTGLTCKQKKYTIIEQGDEKNMKNRCFTLKGKEELFIKIIKYQYEKKKE